MGVSWCGGLDVEFWGERTYDDIPAFGVVVWFPVYDFDSGCRELVTGETEGAGDWGMGTDDSVSLLVWDLCE